MSNEKVVQRAPDVDTFWNYAHTSMRKAMDSDWSSVAWNAFHLPEVRAILPKIMADAFAIYVQGGVPMGALKTAVKGFEPAKDESRAAANMLKGLFRMASKEDGEAMQYFFES